MLVSFGFEPWPTVGGHKVAGQPCPGTLLVLTSWDFVRRWIPTGAIGTLGTWPGWADAAPNVGWQSDCEGGLKVWADYVRPRTDEPVGLATINGDGAITWELESGDEAMRALVRGLFEGLATALVTEPPPATSEVFISAKPPDGDRLLGDAAAALEDRPSRWWPRSWHVLAHPEGPVWRAFEKNPVWWDDGQELVQAEVAQVLYGDYSPSTGLLVKQRDGQTKFWPDQRKALVEPPLMGNHLPRAAHALVEAIDFTA